MRVQAMFGTRQGFTLIEMVVVMGVLGVVLLLGGVTLLGAVRVEQAAEESLRRLSMRAGLADRFRDDVGRAAAAPDRLDKLTAGPTCLILRLTNGGHVVYQWQDGRLQRSERTSAGVSRRLEPVGPDFAAVEFSRTGSDRLLLSVRLSESRGSGVPDRQIVIAALLGGDFQ